MCEVTLELSVCHLSHLDILYGVCMFKLCDLLDLTVLCEGIAGALPRVFKLGRPLAPQL